MSAPVASSSPRIMQVAAKSEGNLLQSNQTVILRQAGESGDSATLEYTIPPGGIAEVYSVTYQDNQDEHPEIDITEVKIQRRGEGQPTSLLDGDATMNLREYAGDGKFPKIWPAIEVADQDSVLQVKVLNRDPSADHDLSLTHNFRVVRVPFGETEEEKRAIARKERLLLFNRTVRLDAATESRLVFSVPKGYNAELKEITGWLSMPESDQVVVKDVRITRPGESEHIELIDGTMTFQEFVGDGKLSRPVVPVQVLRERENAFVLVRNDEPNAHIKVNMTLWMKLIPARQ